MEEDQDQLDAEMEEILKEGSTCEMCGRGTGGADISCPHCHHRDWSGSLVILIVGLLLLLTYKLSFLWLFRFLTAGIGGLLLLLFVNDAVKASGNAPIRHRAILDLSKRLSDGSTRSEAVAGLTDCLADEDPTFRIDALRALAQLQDSQALPAVAASVIQCLADPEEEVRVEAATTLGIIGERQAIPTLREALREDEGTVAEAAARALLVFGTEDISAALPEILGHPDPEIRVQAVGRIGEVDSEESVRVLRKALKDKDRSVRLAVVQALKTQTSPGGQEILESIVRKKGRKDADLRREAMSALGAGQKEDIVSPLVEALRSPSQKARAEAAETLEELGWKAFNNPDRLHMAHALERWAYLAGLGDAGLRLLAGEVDHPNEGARVEIQELLRKAGENAVEPLLDELRRRADLTLPTCELPQLLLSAGWEPLNQEEETFHAFLTRDYARLVASGDVGGKLICLVMADLARELEEGHIADVLGNLEALRDSNGGALPEEALEVEQRTLEAACMLLEGRLGLYSEGEREAFSTLVGALCSYGDPRVAGPVIDFLFFESLGVFDAEDPQFPPAEGLFGGYASLVFRAAHGVRATSTTSGPIEYYGWSKEFDIRDGTDAVAQLCNLNTPVSNNLLHKVLEKPDREETTSFTDLEGEYESTTEVLDFEEQRQLARKELEARGNPKYAPAAYLDPSNWSLKR